MFDFIINFLSFLIYLSVGGFFIAAGLGLLSKFKPVDNAESNIDNQNSFIVSLIKILRSLPNSEDIDDKNKTPILFGITNLEAINHKSYVHAFYFASGILFLLFGAWMLNFLGLYVVIVALFLIILIYQFLVNVGGGYRDIKKYRPFYAFILTPLLVVIFNLNFLSETSSKNNSSNSSVIEMAMKSEYATKAKAKEWIKLIGADSLKRLINKRGGCQYRQYDADCLAVSGDMDKEVKKIAKNQACRDDWRECKTYGQWFNNRTWESNESKEKCTEAVNKANGKNVLQIYGRNPWITYDDFGNGSITYSTDSNDFSCEYSFKSQKAKALK